MTVSKRRSSILDIIASAARGHVSRRLIIDSEESMPHRTYQGGSMTSHDSTLEIRFWKKISKDGPIPEKCPELGPCWLWLAFKDEFGRGQIGTGGKGKHKHAHKVSWEIHNGPVPDGMCV